VRRHITLSTSVLYKKMLVAAENGEYPKVEKALVVLTPLITVINSDLKMNFDTRLKKVISQKDKVTLVFFLKHLIVLSIQESFKEASQSGVSPSQIRQRIKIAYREYLILDPEVRQRSFAKSQVLLQAFRQANRVSGADRRALRRAFQVIFRELDQLFQVRKYHPIK